MIGNHVTHLLTAYVHDQLPRKSRDRVTMHVRLCPDCRATLQQEELLARDIIVTMPLVGKPQRGQLIRLWPAIWRDFRSNQPVAARLLPSYGIILGLIFGVAFLASAFFSGPGQVNAAPSPHVASDIRPTQTPVVTDEPAVYIAVGAEPSEPASFSVSPQASPAPHASGMSEDR